MISMADIFQALALPTEAWVEQRIPKKLLLEHGAPTAADKRKIQEDIEELHRLAAIKPANCAVPAFRDDIREYLEIAVLSVTLRQEAKGERSLVLIHRAIPYPVLLIAIRGEAVVSLTLLHKRFARGEADKVALDGEMISAALGMEAALEKIFLASMTMTTPPAENLFVLYQGWIERIEALAAARITSRFVLPESPQQAMVRRAALAEHGRLEREIAKLRAQAGREKQLNRRLEWNLEIKRLEMALAQVILLF